MKLRNIALLTGSWLVLCPSLMNPAAACDPQTTAPITICALQPCDIADLGSAKLDGDGKNVIACLRSDTAPTTTIWKRMSSSKYTLTDNYVTLVVTSGHGWEWRTCPDGYAMVAAQVSMSDHWEMKCRQITAP